MLKKVISNTTECLKRQQEEVTTKYTLYEVLNEFVKGHEWTTEEDQDLLQKLLRSEVKPRPNGDIGFVFAPEDPRFPRNYFSFLDRRRIPDSRKI